MQQTLSAVFRMNSLALAVVLALCGTATLNASAATSSASAFTTAANTTQLRQGDTVIGALPMNQPMHVVVALKLRNKDALDAFIANNAKNQSGGKSAQLMSSAQLLANHAPTQQQAQAVASYLSSMGFSNVTIAPNRMLVSADGTAATARNAFMTSFAQVRTRDGRIAYANTDDVRISAALSDKVLSVIGLQNVHQPRTATAPVKSSSGVHPDDVITHDPTEFPVIYGGTGAVVASDVAIGIVSNGSVGNNGGLNQVITDLDTFTTNHSLPTVTVDISQPDGADTAAGTDQESDVASQTIVAMAGGQVKRIILYNLATPTDANMTTVFNAIVAGNAVKLVEVPQYGVCETDAQSDGSAAAQDAILETAVAQGQTFITGTGDSGGADECGNLTNTPLWPTASQYVIAVASTLLNASTTTWTSEQVYNQTGGSPSTFEPMPSWQTAFGVPGTTRGTADITFDGDVTSGSKIVFNGVVEVDANSVLASSLFAGLWARVLEARGSGFGFAGPVLYALPATAFHDITVGNNNGGRSGIGYTAATGYDYPSGRGSMIINNVLADSVGLGNQPPVANFTFTSSSLTATFTDTSTDSDGTIAAHSWTFGDGSTSTAANPSHTYAAAGTYTVSEKVTDNDGAVDTKTQSVSVGAVQLLGNSGFETGSPAPWVLSGATNQAFVACNTDPPSDVYDGRCAFVMDADDMNLLQQVTIPAADTSATLSFHLYVEIDDVDGPDKLKVLITNPSGTVLATLATFTNADASSGYKLFTYDMTPFIGETIKVRFNGNSGARNTDFWLDDITLIAQ